MNASLRRIYSLGKSTQLKYGIISPIEVIATETIMVPNPTMPATETSGSETTLRRLLGSMSIFTMLMTIPQVVTIWIGHQAAGVSLLSWGAYFISALLWFWFGISKRDKNIYLPRIGWMALDSAVIAGVIVYG